MSQADPLGVLLSAGQLAAGVASHWDAKKSHNEQLRFARKQHEREMSIQQKNYVSTLVWPFSPLSLLLLLLLL